MTSNAADKRFVLSWGHSLTSRIHRVLMLNRLVKAGVLTTASAAKIIRDIDDNLRLPNTVK